GPAGPPRRVRTVPVHPCRSRLSSVVRLLVAAGRHGRCVEPGQVVAHPVPLGAQVTEVVLARGDGHRLTGGDGDAVADERVGLVGVVGQQADAAHTEVGEDLRAGRVVAGVGGQAEFEVGVEGVPAAFLEFVGAQFGHQADAAPLVAAQVDDDAPALGLDAGQGGVQLGSAVAALGAEDVSGEAFGVDADEDVLPVADVAVDQGDVLDAVDGGAVAVRGEGAVRGGQADLGLPAHGGLTAAAVGDEVLDGDDRQAVLAGERDEFGQPQHAAVLAGDLDDGARRAQSGEPGEVDGGLGVAVAHQDAAGAGAQREDVAGPDQVGGFGGAARQQPEGGGAVGGGDAGGDAVGGGGVDGDGE